jgi:ABC-type branched-subunit amino acid transport system ATPase component
LLEDWHREYNIHLSRGSQQSIAIVARLLYNIMNTTNTILSRGSQQSIAIVARLLST